VEVLPGGKTRVSVDKTDWARLDAMTEDEIHAAALSDPDAQPLTEADLKRMKRTPQCRVIRRALHLTRGRVRVALSYSTRHAARLGAGPIRTGSDSEGLFESDRAQSQRRVAAVAGLRRHAVWRGRWRNHI